MHEYELVVLYHPDLEIDLDKALNKVEGIITGAGGTIVSTDNWGKRKLAYVIDKQDSAIYVVYELQLPAEGVQRVESTLNITDEVLRYLITKVDPKVKAAMAEAAAKKREESDSDAKSGSANEEEK